MLQLTVKVGQQVHIAGVGTIFVADKSGRCVKLGFETEHGPIRIMDDADGERPADEKRSQAD